MTPREQLRKMTAMGEQGALDEKHWYRLVNGMSAGGETNKTQDEYTRMIIYPENLKIRYKTQTIWRNTVNI